MKMWSFWKHMHAFLKLTFISPAWTSERLPFLRAQLYCVFKVGGAKSEIDVWTCCYVSSGKQANNIKLLNVSWFAEKVVLKTKHRTVVQFSSSANWFITSAEQYMTPSHYSSHWNTIATKKQLKRCDMTSFFFFFLHFNIEDQSYPINKTTWYLSTASPLEATRLQNNALLHLQSAHARLLHQGANSSASCEGRSWKGEIRRPGDNEKLEKQSWEQAQIEFAAVHWLDVVPTLFLAPWVDIS